MDFNQLYLPDQQTDCQLAPWLPQALAKLRSNLEQGQPYDGQQLFKTIYHRFRAQKKLQDCYKLLEEGARLQLQEGQLNCGVELAQMLIEVLPT